jgi:Carboxypeptidase regulatory-like domain/Putative binding domain, N-terminal
MLPRTCSRFAGLVVVAALAIGCSRSSPAAPSPPPAAHAAVTIDSISVVGERASSAGAGYVYRLVMRLRETAGVTATIRSAQLTFMNGSDVLMLSHHDQLIPATANVCPASGIIETRELVTPDASPSHPYAATVHAQVSYSDSTGVESTASASAEVPPIGEPEPVTHTLGGVVTDEVTHGGIGGAVVEILNGVNTGAAATTDNSGAYTFSGLAAGTFRVRASSHGFDPRESDVTVPDQPRADFELHRNVPESCAYTVTPSGSVSVPFVGGQFTVNITRISGACGWQASADADWIEPRNASGSGTAALTVSYRSNAAFTGRLGTVTVVWADGQTQLTVGQAAETPAFCRIVAITVNGQSSIDVGAAGGPFTASITPEPGTPPGVCGSWTASASAGITLNGTGSGPAAPASLTFTVQPNPLTAVRSLSITITFAGSRPSTGLTIRQAGR